MGTMEIADADQKLIHDRTPSELEGFFEELNPFLDGQRMLDINPSGEPAMAGSHRNNLLCIVDYSLNFFTVPDNGCIL